MNPGAARAGDGPAAHPSGDGRRRRRLRADRAPAPAERVAVPPPAARRRDHGRRGRGPGDVPPGVPPAADLRVPLGVLDLGLPDRPQRRAGRSCGARERDDRLRAGRPARRPRRAETPDRCGSRSRPRWRSCRSSTGRRCCSSRSSGLRYAEAATVLGVPVGTVKSRVFGARRRRIAALGRTETRATRRPAMRCDDAQLGVSLRADGERPGRAPRTTSTPTWPRAVRAGAFAGGACRTCGPTCGSKPSTTSPTSDRPCWRSWPRPSRTRPGRPSLRRAPPAARRAPGRRSQRWRASSPGRRSSGSAATRPSRGGRRARPRRRGADRRRRLEVRYTVSEAGTGADGAARTFDAHLVYRAPESLALQVQETTADAPAPERADGHADRRRRPLVARGHPAVLPRRRARALPRRAHPVVA